MAQSRFSWPTPSPISFVLAAVASTQLGSAIAKSLFATLGPLGMVTLRVSIAALVLLLVLRPRWRHHPPRAYGVMLLFGLSLAAMNSLFYAAIARIPTGVAVALEFMGPLLVALFTSRQRLDFLWVGLAAVGIVLLTPLPGAGAGLDPTGVGLALLAGACWGPTFYCRSRWVKHFPGEMD